MKHRQNDGVAVAAAKAGLSTATGYRLEKVRSTPPPPRSPRGRRRTFADRERDSVLRAVAAIVGETPGVTLREIGDRLAALRCYPPRGGTHWSTSSVAHLLQVARRVGLVAARR